MVVDKQFSWGKRKADNNKMVFAAVQRDMQSVYPGMQPREHLSAAGEKRLLLI